VAFFRVWLQHFPRVVERCCGPSAAGTAEKFTTVDLSSFFNTSPREFGSNFPDQLRQDLAGIPAGRSTLQSIPFLLGEGGEKKAWLVVREQLVEVLLTEHKAGYICLAQFCDWFESDMCPNNPACEKRDEDVDPVGAHLADVVLVYF
jgi:hypothetical protein